MACISALIAAAISSASFWEDVEYCAMGAVMLGVVGEYTADFTPLKSSAHWKPLVDKWSTLLLIAALAIELVATVRANDINNHLRSAFSVAS